MPAVSWKIVETKSDTVAGAPVVVKRLVGHVDNSSYPAINVDIQLTLALPASAKAPVPVVVEFGFIMPPGFKLP